MDLKADPVIWLQNGAHVFDNSSNAFESVNPSSYNMTCHLTHSSLSGINPQHLQDQRKLFHSQEEPNLGKSEESQHGDNASHMLNDFTNFHNDYDSRLNMRGVVICDEPSSSMSPPKYDVFITRLTAQLPTSLATDVYTNV